MGLLLKVGGVNKTSDLHEPSGVEVDLSGSERSTARFTAKPGYVPGLRDEVTIYDQDEVTPIFGGIVFERRTRGAGQHLFIDCDCVDWSWYLDHISVNAGTLPKGSYTLKAVLQWFQTTYMAGFGFVLDAAQVTGPTVKTLGYSWERMPLPDALRIVGRAAGGYVFQIDPNKTWRMIKPSLATPTAPFSITDGNSNARVLEWTETSEHYAERIILRWGGTGTREFTTFADTGDLIALGYFITAIPSTPDGKVTVSVSGSVTLTDVVAGPPLATGTYFNWNWETHAIHYGTLYTPQIGDLVTLKYTAQYPAESIADAVIPPLVERVVTDDTISDPTTAELQAEGLVAAAYQNARIFEIESIKDGLRPGQVITINSTYRASASSNAMITNVKITMREITTVSGPIGKIWSYRATATGGIYQGSGLDFWRGLGTGSSGSGSTATSTYTGTVPTTVEGQPLTRTNDTNITATLGGSHVTALVNPASITLGWTGTLAAGRLNANVVQSVSNETNLAGTISAQNLSLVWQGILAADRGGTGFGTYAVGDLLYASATTTLGKLSDVAAGRYLRSGGVSTAPLWSTLVLPNSITANRVVYGASTNTYGDSASLTFDGTTLTTHTLAVATGNATFAANANPVTNYVSNLGSLSTKYLTLHAAELWVETLVAQETMATIGGRILVGPTTTLSQDLPSGQAYLKLAHNQIDTGDLVYMESSGKLEWMAALSWTITGVSTINENFVVAGNQTPFFPAAAQFAVRGSTGNNGTWTVSASTHNAGPNTTTINVTGNVTNATVDGYIAYTILPTDGQYTYLVNRDLDGTGMNQWYAGDAVFNTGTTGDGFIDLFSVNGMASGAGPTIIGNVRTGTTYSNIAPRWAIGNLNNIFNYSAADVYGAAFGDPSASYITIDATNGIRFRNSTTTKFAVDTSGNLSLTGNLTIGTAGALMSGATAYGTGTGYWLDYNSGTPRFRIGTTSGDRMQWDGTNLTVVGSTGTIDTNGITLTPNTSGGYSAARSYDWSVANGNLGATGVDTSTLRQYAITSTYTSGGSTTQANIVLVSTFGANACSISLSAFSGSATVLVSGNTQFDAGVQFGTHSAIGAEAVTGYITITDSGGTPRKLAVVS
jgi:hypothetical protein